MFVVDASRYKRDSTPAKIAGFFRGGVPGGSPGGRSPAGSARDPLLAKTFGETLLASAPCGRSGRFLRGSPILGRRSRLRRLEPDYARADAVSHTTTRKSHHSAASRSGTASRSCVRVERGELRVGEVADEAEQGRCGEAELHHRHRRVREQPVRTEAQGSGFQDGRDRQRYPDAGTPVRRRLDGGDDGGQQRQYGAPGSISMVLPAANSTVASALKAAERRRDTPGAAVVSGSVTAWHPGGGRAPAVVAVRVRTAGTGRRARRTARCTPGRSRR